MELGDYLYKSPVTGLLCLKLRVEAFSDGGLFLPSLVGPHIMPCIEEFHFVFDNNLQRVLAAIIQGKLCWLVLSVFRTCWSIHSIHITNRHP